MALQPLLPWTKSPLIINGPMAGIAGADLAIAVSKAGGLGQIGATIETEKLASQLSKVESTLGRHNGRLPVGVGLRLFTDEDTVCLPVLEKFNPAVVWLFGASQPSDYARVAEKIRKTLPNPQIWIQICSVQEALDVARQAQPDVMCVQGSDAGGHGFERGAGIISLLPEVSDALANAGFSKIQLVAAGGIADSRGASAALVLGAQGVVMGTRFLSTPEAMMHPQWRAAIIAARDGGQCTARSKIFDEVRGPNRWPGVYDGRSLRTASLEDHLNGVDLEELRKLHAQAVKGGNGGFATDGKGRATAWAGTGVGLVVKEQPAAQIVEEVRSGIVAQLKKLGGAFE